MAWDSIWEKVFEENEWGKYPAESLIRFIARDFYKKDRAAVNILELGCGPGANIWYFAREGFAAHGIDGSPTAIEKAKKRLAAEGLTANLHVGDVGTLPYPDAFFDVVVDAECLSCISRSDVLGVLSETRRVLKAGGLFYSRTFSEKMHTGCDSNSMLEFSSVPSGPLKGKGFTRLVTEQGATELYGEFFDDLCIDETSWTLDKRSVHVHEYVITGRRKA